MKKFIQSPLSVFACGTVIAALIIGLSLLFVNPPQCPNDRYQSGITNCITGANIGLGLALLSAIGIWIIAILVSLTIYVRNTLTNKNTSKWILVTEIMLIVLITVLTAYMVVWFLLVSLSS